MTVTEAIETVRRVGSITAHEGKLRLAFPAADRAELSPALDALRANRAEVTALLGGPSAITNAAGVRILRTPAGGYIVAVPAVTDGPEVRRALEGLGMGRLPVWVVAS